MTDKLLQHMSFWRQIRELRRFFTDGRDSVENFDVNYRAIFTAYGCADWRIVVDDGESHNVLDLLDEMTEQERCHVLQFIFAKSEDGASRPLEDRELDEVAGAIAGVAAVVLVVAVANALAIANVHTVANAVAAANAGVAANVAAMANAVSLGGGDGGMA